MQKTYTCIICPKGCTVILDTQSMQTTGNSCTQGEKYAKQEYTCPKRVVTSTIACANPNVKRISVKTDEPIEMSLIDALLQDIAGMQLALPIHTGDVIIQNYKNTGVNIVSTCTIQ